MREGVRLVAEETLVATPHARITTCVRPAAAARRWSGGRAYSCYLIKHGNDYGITAPTPMQGANVAGFKSWIDEKGKVEPLTGDKDVFGDGSVMVLRMPGHTPGHSCLLVRLKDMGPVLLTGDLVHFRENYESGGVPHFNFDRAATVASIDRMKQIVANLKATVIIQHDMRDIGKLPAFPAAAK